MKAEIQTIFARHFTHAQGTEPCAQFVCGRWYLPRDKDSLDLMMQEVDEFFEAEIAELEEELAS